MGPGGGPDRPGNALDGVDVVVNLSGVNLFTWPWTTYRREKILSSRVNTTDTLARALAKRAAGDGERPVLLAQSAIGYYGGVSGQRPHTEESSAGRDFAAQVCVQWEAPTRSRQRPAYGSWSCGQPRSWTAAGARSS